MAEPLWLLVWVVAGIPVLSILFEQRLRRKISDDYAYYVEWSSFPFTKDQLV